MIISWRGSTVYAGCTFNSTSSPLTLHGLNFGIYKAPTEIFEYNARISTGNGINFGRFNCPTTTFDYHTNQRVSTWNIDTVCGLLWSRIGVWTIAEVDSDFWTPDGLIVFSESNYIAWDVRSTRVTNWPVDEVDGQSWVINIKGTRENCLTGDGVITGAGPTLLPQIW